MLNLFQSIPFHPFTFYFQKVSIAQVQTFFIFDYKLVCMKKHILTPLCLIVALFVGNTVLAQNDLIFKNALAKYDELVNKYNDIKGKEEKADDTKTITKEKYETLKKTIDESVDLFDQYIRISTETEKVKAARHYLLVVKKMDFTFNNDLRNFSANFQKINTLDAELTTIKGYYYPIKYGYDGKNYSITYDKRSSMEKGLLVEFIETSTNLGKSDEVIKFAKRAYPLYSIGDYNLWWVAHLWYYHSNKLFYSDERIVEPSEKLIYSMTGLKRSDIKKIKDSNWVNYTHAYNKLNSVLASKPSLSKGGEVWAKAAESFEKLDENTWALEYYNKALKEGYGDRSFLLKMMEFGKRKNNKELVGTAVNIYDAKNLYQNYYCSDFLTIAEYFEYAGNSSKAKELKAKNKECTKAQTKKQRRAERGGKFFISFAPLALLSGNIQGSIQIGGNKRLHEFGVKKTGEQRDRGLDMTLRGGNSITNLNPESMTWSGMSYYYTYKKFTKGGSNKAQLYYGFQLRYTNKEYETQTARVRNNTNNATTNLLFAPKETRYDMVFHQGILVVGKIFHLDMYYGMGAGYSVFDGGAPQWNNTGFTVQNHDFLSARKDTRFGVTFRMGLKIGLNIINR